MTLNAKAKALAYLEAKTMTLNVRAKALAYLEAKTMTLECQGDPKLKHWATSLGLPGSQNRRHGNPGAVRGYCLLVAVDDAAAVEVVRAELNRDAVAGEDTDEVFAHASGDVSKRLMLVLKLDLEHRIWQRFDDYRHHFNRIFLRQTISFGKVGG